MTAFCALAPAIWASTGNPGTGFCLRYATSHAPGRRAVLADTYWENATEEIRGKARLLGPWDACLLAGSQRGLLFGVTRSWLCPVQWRAAELLVRPPFRVPVSDTELGASLVRPGQLTARQTPVRGTVWSSTCICQCWPLTSGAGASSSSQSRLADGFVAWRTADLRWAVTIRPSRPHGVYDRTRLPRRHECTKQAWRTSAGRYLPVRFRWRPTWQDR